MGNCCSADAAADANSGRVMFVGLDGAGATTILYQLKLGKRLETIPTLGVNHEVISHDNLDLQCWDIGGLDKMRPLWNRYLRKSDAIIFVVDSSDMSRLKLAADELARIFTAAPRQPAVPATLPLLIFANKQDLPSAASPELVHDVLRVSSLPAQSVKIFPCTVNDRQTLLNGLSWLTAKLKDK